MSMTIADKACKCKFFLRKIRSLCLELSSPGSCWHSTVNRMVAGSSPARGANCFNMLSPVFGLGGQKRKLMLHPLSTPDDQNPSPSEQAPPPAQVSLCRALRRTRFPPIGARRFSPCLAARRRPVGVDQAGLPALTLGAAQGL
jgi:hypothetical protein